MQRLPAGLCSLGCVAVSAEHTLGHISPGVEEAVSLMQIVAQCVGILLPNQTRQH